MTQFATGEIKFKPEILIGKNLGKYEVKEIIGRGGMAVVFKSWDTLEKRFKCLKIIPPQASADQLSLKKLRREVLNASEIAHPNVVKVFGFEEEKGMYFIVMEYLEGKTLSGKMADSKEDRLPEKEVLDIMIDVASALRESHKRKVIHCDLKPQNIMFTRDGEVKVLDFSISFQITRSLTMSTGEGFYRGTIPYMAPEQLSKKFGRIDEQTDVWGFGATMYHMLSGEPPFDDREQIIAPDEIPHQLKNISEKTRNIVFGCLEKDKAKRFKNMDEVLAVLQEKQDNSKKDLVKKLIERAVVFFDHGEYEKAIVVLEQASEIFPGDSDAKQFLSETKKKIAEKKNAAKDFVNIGNEYYRSGNYEQAIPLYEKALTEQPNFALAYYNMGAAYDKLHKYDEALEAYKNAIKFDPFDNRAYNNMIKLLNKIDKSKISFAFLGSKKNNNDINILPLSVGVETLGGITHKIIKRNTQIPTQATDIFTTADDNQSSVEIHVVAGEYEMARDNLTLGKFTLKGIPPAPRGVPQIEVNFEINKDGAFCVSAKDTATNKQHSINTAFSPNLSASDIEKMIIEAENHAIGDKKKKEQIENRNKLDQLIYALEKLVKENKEKISISVVNEIEKAVQKSKKVIISADNNEILEEIDNINKLMPKFSNELYRNVNR